MLSNSYAIPSLAKCNKVNQLTMSKRRLIFAGTPEFAANSLQALIAQQSALNIEIVAVYTQPDRKAGRGQKLTASPVKEVALAHGIPVEQPLTFKKSSAEGMVSRETLANYQPDIMVVAAYGLILPLGVLKTPTFGCLNIHASLLPRWRGAAPIHRAHWQEIARPASLLCRWIWVWIRAICCIKWPALSLKTILQKACTIN